VGVGPIMPRVRIEVEGFRCARCGHEWVPRRRTEDPRVCPRCKSPYWDRERSIAGFRAEVLVRGAKGWSPRPETLRALETQISALTRVGKAGRRPEVRWAGNRLRITFDLRASSEGNAASAARRLVDRRMRTLGLLRPGSATEVRVRRHAGHH
jgi:hypothetical protein